jgi:hypothetical protein
MVIINFLVISRSNIIFNSIFCQCLLNAELIVCIWGPNSILELSLHQNLLEATDLKIFPPTQLLLQVWDQRNYPNPTTVEVDAQIFAETTERGKWYQECHKKTKGFICTWYLNSTRGKWAMLCSFQMKSIWKKEKSVGVTKASLLLLTKTRLLTQFETLQGTSLASTNETVNLTIFLAIFLTHLFLKNISIELIDRNYKNFHISIGHYINLKSK